MPEIPEKQLLDRLAAATARGRALLCALARLGKWMQGNDPGRASLLLAASQINPLYKGGRLLFDLLEIEDLMLDGLPPDRLDGEELGAATRELTSAFVAFLRALDRPGAETSLAAVEVAPGEPGNGDGPWLKGAAMAGSPGNLELPEIDAADYLYDLVVLGTLHQVSRDLRPKPPAEQPEEESAEESLPP